MSWPGDDQIGIRRISGGGLTADLVPTETAGAWIGDAVRRIIRSAKTAEQSDGSHKVTSVTVLASILSDGSSTAAQMLRAQHLTLEKIEHVLEEMERLARVTLGMPESRMPEGYAPPTPSVVRKIQRPTRAGRPLVDPAKLVENIPRSMRVGVPVMVEVRIARPDVEDLALGMQGGGTAFHHEIMATKAMSVQLRAAESDFWIESRSPETQWREHSREVVADVREDVQRELPQLFCRVAFRPPATLLRVPLAGDQLEPGLTIAPRIAFSLASCSGVDAIAQLLFGVS